MSPPVPPNPPQPPNPGVDPGEVAAKDWIRVEGTVSSKQMAALSRQIWYLTAWGKFLDTIDWSQVPTSGGGGAGKPPPPPPNWPP